MIKNFVNGVIENKQIIKEQLREKLDYYNNHFINHEITYSDLVKMICVFYKTNKLYEDKPDLEKIHEIGDKTYQGNIIYIIGGEYDSYWYLKFGYGSCCGCDTLEAAIIDDFTQDQQIQNLYMIVLHMAQSIKLIEHTELTFEEENE